MDMSSTLVRVAIGASRQQSVPKYDVHVVLGFTIVGIILILF